MKSLILLSMFISLAAFADTEIEPINGHCTGGLVLFEDKCVRPVATAAEIENRLLGPRAPAAPTEKEALLPAPAREVRPLNVFVPRVAAPEGEVLQPVPAQIVRPLNTLVPRIEVESAPGVAVSGTREISTNNIAPVSAAVQAGAAGVAGAAAAGVAISSAREINTRNVTPAGAAVQVNRAAASVEEANSNAPSEPSSDPAIARLNAALAAPAPAAGSPAPASADSVAALNEAIAAQEAGATLTPEQQALIDAAEEDASTDDGEALEPEGEEQAQAPAQAPLAPAPEQTEENSERDYKAETCEWVSDMPRRIVHSPGCSTRSRNQLCVGHVVCEAKSSAAKFIRMSSCAADKCDDAQACTKDQAYFSTQPDSEDKKFMSKRVRDLISTPAAQQ